MGGFFDLNYSWVVGARCSAGSTVPSRSVQQDKQPNGGSGEGPDCHLLRGTDDFEPISARIQGVICFSTLITAGLYFMLRNRGFGSESAFRA